MQSCGIVAKQYVVGSAMVPLDRAMTNFYGLSIVIMSICSGLAANCNFACKVSACSHHAPTSAELLYRILALIAAFDIAASPQRVWDRY